MCKIVRLKVRDMDSDGNILWDEIIKIKLEKHYRKEFKDYWNKKGECWEIEIVVFGEDESGMVSEYRKEFRSQSEAVENGQKFVDQWFRNVRITYL